MALAEISDVTSGGKERVDRAADILADAFSQDPAYTYFFHDVPQDQRQARRRRAIGGFVKACTLNEGEVIEAGDWGSCGILMSPGQKAENPFTLIQAGLIQMIIHVGFAHCKRIIFGYTSAADALKKKALSEESDTCWYVFLIGTATEKRHQGLASKIILRMQDKARSDGRPLWLEASSQNSHRLFLKHGFKDAGALTLGEGIVDSSGVPKENGEGVPIWGMVWRP